MSNNDLKVFNSITELIAREENPTPLVRINKVSSSDTFHIYCKLEWFNPFGSIKDRTAWYLLKGLEERGELDGKRVVEPTSGNTGIALAAIGNVMGHKTTVTIPDAVPEEKQLILRLLGAEVWPTPDDLCPIEHPKDGAIALARNFLQGERKGKYVMPNQYENPDNVKAHYETTGPEIWRQTEGKITHFLAGYGTCGTITGVGRFLKEQNPDITVVAIEPQKNHRLPGLKNMEESKPPGILDSSVIDDVVRVNDDDAYETTIRLVREEGMLVGPSTGAIVWAALPYAKNHDGLAVVISPDSAFKYMSYFKDIVGQDGMPKEQ